MTETIMNEENGVVDPVFTAPDGEPESKKDFKKKPNTEKCKILFYNKYSGNFAFTYRGKEIQVTLEKGLDFENDTVNVRYVNGKYNIVD